MDAAVTALTPANQAAMLAEATPDTPRGPLARLQALPARKKTLLAFGTAGLLAVMVALMLWSRHVPMAPLYPGSVPQAEMGPTLDYLRKAGIPSEIAHGGLVLVPEDKVEELRVLLSSQGIRKGPTDPFAEMDRGGFGKTSMQERAMFMQALNKRLEQQFAKLNGVEAADVNVALTHQTGFYRDEAKPTASVTLTLRPGYTLDRNQIAGIISTTANSVPGLLAKDVSVMDQDSNPLNRTDGDARSDLTQQQRMQLRETETRLLKRVNEILEKAVGRDNMHATVTAELDFNQVEQTSEAYVPNQGADARVSVRSTSNVEVTGTTPPQPTGVPGAATNQAPTPATAPATAASATPPQAAQAGLASTGTRRENVINYDVGKTVETRRAATGEIRRVNVAVLVNHVTTSAPKTGKLNSAPLPQEQIDKLTALVQEAVGYKKERGDSVQVVNIPFRAEPKTEPEAVPVYKQPWLIDLLKVGGLPAALTLVALMLLFGVVRPALRPDPPPPPPPPEPENALSAVVDDTEALPGPDEAELLALENNQKVEAQLTDARQLAKQNPVAVANILRSWMEGES
jgi:flagellar M-ring protein FliF